MTEVLLCPVCRSGVSAADVVCVECGTDLAAAPPVSVEPAAEEPASLLPPSVEVAADEEAVEPTAAPEASLTLKRGGAPVGEPYPVRGAVAIGRYDIETGPVEVDLNGLPEATYVSRRHAEIVPEDGGWIIRDLGSRNGTFIRRRGTPGFVRISDSQPLQDGDEVSLGNAQLEFRIEA